MNVYENLDINNLDGEIWKVIDDFPDYSVSNLGRVKRIISDEWNHKLKILKQKINHRGYLQVKLTKNKERKTKVVHVLLYETFYNYKLKNIECVHHKDENKENNYYINLEKMTKKYHREFHMIEQNNPNFGKHLSVEHKNKISLSQPNRSGERHPNHKLSNQDIYDIRKSLELKLYTPKQLSWMFDMSLCQIYKIKNNETWTNL